MTLIIETPKSDVDFLRMAEIRAQAFGSDYEKVLIHFPRLSTPEGQAMLRDRMIKMQKDLRSVRFAVVRDTETGEIISQAQWHFYEKDDKGDILVLDFLEGSEEEKEYGRYLMGTFQAKRRQAIEQTKVPLMLLSNLATDPAHQRRGAGTMLVKWGLEIADEAGGEAYVEGSVKGKAVYEKFGFVALENYTVPLPPKWAAKSPFTVCLMRRPVTGNIHITL